jgi:hypothetical protein
MRSKSSVRGDASRKLRLDEHDKLILKLKSSKAVTFSSLGKLIKLNEDFEMSQFSVYSLFYTNRPLNSLMQYLD